MRNLLISFLLSFSFLTSYGQIEEVRRITKTLCSPEFNGRGYVNGGDSVAADFIVNEFKKIGLKPFKKDYLQHFSFLYSLSEKIHKKTLFQTNRIR